MHLFDIFSYQIKLRLAYGCYNIFFNFYATKYNFTFHVLTNLNNCLKFDVRYCRQVYRTAGLSQDKMQCSCARLRTHIDLYRFSGEIHCTTMETNMCELSVFWIIVEEAAKRTKTVPWIGPFFWAWQCNCEKCPWSADKKGQESLAIWPYEILFHVRKQRSTCPTCGWRNCVDITLL